MQMAPVVRSLLVALYVTAMVAGGFARPAVKPSNEPTPRRAGTLFPLFGVTLGRTTVEELARLATEQSPYGYCVVGGYRFWHHGKEHAVHLVLSGQPMIFPERWKKLGFRCDISYLGWLALLRQRGYAIRVVVEPHFEIYQEKRCFAAKLQVDFTEHGVPLRLELEFRFGPGNESSAGTLYELDVTVR